MTYPLPARPDMVYCRVLHFADGTTSTEATFDDETWARWTDEWDSHTDGTPGGTVTETGPYSAVITGLELYSAVIGWGTNEVRPLFRLLARHRRLNDHGQTILEAMRP